MGLSFFVRSWWPREYMLQGSSMLSKFCTSLSKVLTLWHCVKVKQRYPCSTTNFSADSRYSKFEFWLPIPPLMRTQGQLVTSVFLPTIIIRRQGKGRVVMRKSLLIQKTRYLFILYWDFSSSSAASAIWPEQYWLPYLSMILGSWYIFSYLSSVVWWCIMRKKSNFICQFGWLHDYLKD